jgi:predicted extracellular nuclease
MYPSTGRRCPTASIGLAGALLAASLCAGTAQASLLVKDTFDVADGRLVGHVPTPGPGGAWAAHSAANSKAIQIAAGAASLVQSSGSGEDANVALSRTQSTSETLYAGFDLVVTGTVSTVYFAHFKTSGTTYTSRAFVVAGTGGTFGVGLSATSGSPQVSWSTPLALGSAHRIVHSYNAATGEVRLWVDPVDASSPSIAVSGTAGTLNTGYALRQDTAGNSGQSIDNLRVSDTFAEAVGADTPAPDTAPPAIAGSSPANGATGVATDIAAMLVDFTEVLGGGSSAAGVTLECPAGAPIAGTSGFSDTDTLSLVPGAALPAGTHCTLTIPAGALVDAVGNANAAALTVAFDTAAAVVASRTLPFSEGFASCTLADWRTASVDTDTANTWYCASGTMQANGYGDTAAANEWLILPPVDMGTLSDERLSFDSSTRYLDNGQAHPQIEVLYSTDYDGSGNPASGTWIPLSGASFSPANSQAWTGSGQIDVSGIAGNRVWFAFRYRSSGTANNSAAYWQIDNVTIQDYVAPPPVAGCGDPATLVSAIQGHTGTANWPQTPMLGSAITVEALVTATFHGASAGMNGFFVQEDNPDSNPQTSEGLFVYDPSGLGSAVQVGDLVRIDGAVGEYNQKTQLGSLGSVAVCSAGNPLPATVAPTLPEAVNGDLEFVENMRVAIPGNLIVAQTYFLGRYGQLTLASADASGALTRPYQPTHLYEAASADAFAEYQENARRLLFLDDGLEVNSLGDNPTVVPFIGAAPNNAVIRSGDRVSGLVGILDQGRIDSASPAGVDYRIQPTEPPMFAADNPRTASPPSVGGRLKVGSFNVLNYFNGNGLGGGFPTARGATDANELDRQSDKIVSAICALGADLLGLMEIENDGADEVNGALAELVGRLNAGPACIAAGRTWAAVDAGTFGTDEIATAFIYDPAKVTMVGNPAKLLAASFLDPTGSGTDRNRPALAQTFRELATGQVFTVVVNHLKSKGSSCGVGDDDPPFPTGTNQGNCNLTRSLAAQRLREWLGTDPTGSGDPDFLIVGDLNSYAQEEPILALQDPSLPGPVFTDLARTLIGESAFSYVFDGQSGYLDHGLANTSLSAQVTGIVEWHINADEPEVINYNTEYNAGLYYDADPYRSSDHDPVLIGLDLINIIDGTPGSETIMGTAGDDSIRGNGGQDTIVTGGGNDLVRFPTVGDMGGTISDFVPGSDLIDLAGLGVTSANPIASGHLQFRSAKGSTTVLFDADGTAGRGRPRTLTLLNGVGSAGAARLSNFTGYGY